MTDKITRRDFAKATGVAAAASAATGMAVPSRQARAAGADPNLYPDLYPDREAFVASEKEKWDALNAHMTPQFDGVRAFHQHAYAKYRVAVIGSPHLVSTPDPDSPEFSAMFKGNSEELIDVMRPNARRDLKDADPKLWDEMAAESDGLAAALRQCGVKVIRCEKRDLTLPQGLINQNVGWGGPRFLTVYAGPSYGRIVRNVFFHTWDNSLNGTMEFMTRQGTMRLFEQNPDLVYHSIPFPEPNFSNPGFGSLFMDVASWRHMPGKVILFGFGAPDEKTMKRILTEPDKALGLTPAGTPQTARFMMQSLEQYGFTSETWFYDSKLSYHSDCVMSNMAEGFVGLPDLPNYGIIGGKLPNCIKDWEIIKMPVEEVKLGAANQICFGDGRVIIVRTAKETIKRMEKAGLEPIPVKYDKIWEYYHSGPDCSDADIWRENDPIKMVATEPASPEERLV